MLVRQNGLYQIVSAIDCSNSNEYRLNEKKWFYAPFIKPYSCEIKHINLDKLKGFIVPNPINDVWSKLVQSLVKFNEILKI